MYPAAEVRVKFYPAAEVRIKHFPTQKKLGGLWRLIFNVKFIRSALKPQNFRLRRSFYEVNPLSSALKTYNLLLRKSPRSGEKNLVCKIAAKRRKFFGGKKSPRSGEKIVPSRKSKKKTLTHGAISRRPERVGRCS